MPGVASVCDVCGNSRSGLGIKRSGNIRPSEATSRATKGTNNIRTMPFGL